MEFLVIGDSCTDKFIYGTCERLCPEGPVPVFQPTGATSNGGMAKNVQANVEALGVRCDIITNKNLIEKIRYVDRKTNQLLLRVDVNDRATDSFNIKEVAWDKYDAVIVSDYNKGFLCGQAIRLICLEHDNVFFDTKRRLECDLPRNLRFIKLNEHELELNRGLKLCLGEGPSTTNQQTKQIIVTHGNKGCWYAGKMYPCLEKIVGQDLSGAGDTFLSALAILITEGGSVESAINFANKCSCEVVKKRGVATV